MAPRQADQSALESWINTISGVAVNSVPCGRSDYSMGATDRHVAVATSGFRTNAVNTVVISAEQYADLVLTVTLDAAGSPVKSSSSGGGDGQPSASGGNPAAGDASSADDGVLEAVPATLDAPADVKVQSASVAVGSDVRIYVKS